MRNSTFGLRDGLEGCARSTRGGGGAGDRSQKFTAREAVHVPGGHGREINIVDDDGKPAG